MPTKIWLLLYPILINIAIFLSTLLFIWIAYSLRFALLWLFWWFVRTDFFVRGAIVFVVYIIGIILEPLARLIIFVIPLIKYGPLFFIVRHGFHRWVYPFYLVCPFTLNLDSQTNKDKQTILEMALIYNQIECFQKLLQYFPESFHKRSSSDLLRIALKYDRPRAILALKSCKMLEQTQAAGISALRQTIFWERPQSIVFISKCFPRVDINASNLNSGETVLMFACATGHPDCLKALKEAYPKIKINVMDHQGNSAIVYAFRNPKCFKIIDAIAQYFPEVDVSSKNKHGNSVLFNAVSYPYHTKNLSADKVLYLLRFHFGKSPLGVNLQNNEGLTVLMYCILHSQVDCIRALRYCFGLSLDVDIKAKNGETALMLAARSSTVNSIIELLQWFPHIDRLVWNKQCRTALQIALNCQRLENVRALLEFERSDSADNYLPF